MNNTSSNYEVDNIAYWTSRTSGYSEVNKCELQSNQYEVWATTLDAHIQAHHSSKTRKETRVLDVGTGPGFFAIVLAEKNYRVTAIDYTDSMLNEASKNAETLGAQIYFRKMNAEALTFADGSFDVIVTRNLTWNLLNPENAYRQWARVLAPGGLLLNFDAGWYNYLYDSKARDGYLRDRENIKSAGVNNETAGTDISAMEAIACQAPLSTQHRPEWDITILRGLGLRTEADTEVWKTVWTYEEKVNNDSTPMFLVKAIKEASVEIPEAQFHVYEKCR